MKVFVYDLDKCNGCHNCQIACKDEHCGNDWSPYALPQPDTGQFWCRVDEETVGTAPHVNVNYLPHRCNHCGNAPCMDAAPDAVYRRDDGLVVIDPAKARGKRDLVAACPYGEIFWNEELQVAQKCTGCAHLLDDGWKEPRCVDACCTGALRFGEEEDFAEELERAVCLKPECGTAPRVWYLNLPKRFIAATLVDIDADEVVVGAKVTIQNQQTEEVRSLESDFMGDVVFDKLDPGHWRMWVEKEGYLSQFFEIDLTEKDKAFPELRFYRDPKAA